MSNLNLFDLSPRELTNSAVWIWLLDGLRNTSPSMRKEIAVALLEELQVPVPDQVNRLQSEWGLADGRRIDIYMEGTRGGEPYIFFIENKVSHDASVDVQIRGYLDALQAHDKPIYSAVFSLHPGIGQLIATSSQFNDENCPVVFDPDKMIALLERFELHPEGIPAEFLKHLVARRNQLQRVRNAILRGGADPDAWLAVARQNGVESLFSRYIDLATEQQELRGESVKVAYFHGRSVAVMGRSRRPLLSLHPLKSDGANGLWLGYNDVNWRYHFGRDFPLEVLPENFANRPDSKQPNWHFGYFVTEGALERFFSGFAAY